MNRIYILNEQNIDLTDVAVAACPEHDGELGNLQEEEIASYIENLQYPRRYGYFNAGVMMINLDYWRKHNIGYQLIKYLIENYKKCLWLDQDVLNAVLYKVRKFIPIKFNFMTQFLSSDSDAIDFRLKENPVIVHYSSPCKPLYFYSADYPFRKEWEYYRCISPWRRWRGNAPLLLKLR